MVSCPILSDKKKIPHSSLVGTAKYASDLVDCFKAIESDYGNSVRAVHGFPIFKSGLEDHTVTRSLLDIMDWLEDVDKRCLAHLATPLRDYRHQFLLDQSETVSGSTVRLPLQLPSSVRKRETATYQSTGHKNLREKIPPCSEENAAEFIQGLSQQQICAPAGHLCEPAPTAGRREQHACAGRRHTVSCGGWEPRGEAGKRYWRPTPECG